MPANLKALIVVLAISAVMFSVAKPLALRFGSESDFTRRRNVWLVLTIIGFLSPNFWLFALVAIPVLAWGSRKDSNPVAFYLIMLHVIPVVEIPIPVVWMQSLFSLEIYRIARIVRAFSGDMAVATIDRSGSSTWVGHDGCPTARLWLS